MAEMSCAGFSIAFGSTGCSGSASGRAAFAPLARTLSASLRSKRFQWARSEPIFPAAREWGERKKKLEGGGEERRRKCLPSNPSIFKTTHLQSRQSCHILTNGREAHESPVRRLFTFLIYNTKRDSRGFFNNTSL